MSAIYVLTLVFFLEVAWSNDCDQFIREITRTNKADVFHSKRLKFTPVEADDTDSASRYLSMARHPDTVSATRDYPSVVDVSRIWENSSRSAKSGEFSVVNFEVRSGENSVGFVQLGRHRSSTKNEKVGVIGFMVAPGTRGQRYGNEIVDATLEYAFRHANMKKVLAKVLPNNTRSLHLLEQRGFRRTGEIEGDHLVLELSKPEK